MSPFGARSLRRGRLVVATTVSLVVLALSGVLHLKHHLDDPHCGSSPIADSHPCVSCAGLHGSAVVENTEVPTARIPVRPLDAHAAEAARPERLLRGVCSSRAPPSA